MQAAQGGKFGRGPVAQRCEAQPRKVRAGAQGREHWNAEQGQRSHGFLSAGVTQFASERIGKIDPAGAHGRASRIIASALVGGSVSRLTGGKFAHGAVTAAFSRGFNDEMEHGGEMDQGGPEKLFEDMVHHAAELFEGALFPAIDGSLATGERASAFWAEKSIESGNVLYDVPGLAASLWTRETAAATSQTLVGGAIVSPLAVSASRAFGPLKQWIRLGESYSKTLGTRISYSVRWGASPVRNGIYLKQIGSPSLQKLNQWLRAQRLPGKSWRTADPGHLHLRR